jgi:hypothetical protein
MLKRYAWQWLIFWLGVILGGCSLVVSPFRKDEGPGWFKDNVGLDVKDADGRLQDGVEEAFARVWTPGRLTHDLKNVPREWVRAEPKRAFKVLSFVIVVLLASHLI